MNENANSPSDVALAGVIARMTYHGFKTRDLGQGIHLLGGCFHSSMSGRESHTHASAYLVIGTDRSILIDTGHAKDGANIVAYIRSRVGDRLDYIFPTHEEYPHAGNVDALLTAFPGAIVVGDVRNYHLYHPSHYADGRFEQLDFGTQIDLGGRRVEVLKAVIRDLPWTCWAYDDLSQTMFVSDAFAYSHHEESECTLLAEELPIPPSVADTRFVMDTALYSLRYSKTRELVEEMNRLLETRSTRLVAPAHGNVVSDPAEFAKLMDEAVMSISA